MIPPIPEHSPSPTADSESRRVHPRLAVVLTGGGARGAYQVGVLRGLGRAFPNLRFPIITGVSAGAVNATFLASRPESLGTVSQQLAEIWSKIEVENVIRSNLPSMAKTFLKWVTRLSLGGGGPQVRAFLDTAPLRELMQEIFFSASGNPRDPIHGIRGNIEAGHLMALALSTVNYGTGQTIHWVQGKNITPWEAPSRRALATQLTVDHVMASAALPLIFPAVKLNDDWYGDGGIRMAAPLSPALHMGADRILAVSTRYDRSQQEAEDSAINDYPPPAQILGNLMNAIFLDVLDQDVKRLERLNEVVRKIPPASRGGLKPIRLQLLRPSEDLGRLAGDVEPRLPKGLRFFNRSLGASETKSPDFMSLLMFQPEYVMRLIEIGERDVLTQLEDLRTLLFDTQEETVNGRE